MSSLKEDLCGDGVELIETHTAWVFLAEKTVIKVKKPVDYGFLNFSTLERRKAVCEAEVRLNARLAPNVYDGVERITRDAAGRHRVGGDGELVDYAVKMRRLADSARGDLLLAEGRLGAPDIDALALYLAAFHASLASTAAQAAPFGSKEAIERNVTENFRQTHDAIRACVSDSEALQIERQQTDFLNGRRPLLEHRVQKGRIRDGHGDLRLEHVYFEGHGPPTIIDCLEFADRFRYADVCSDIAFLSMDLRRLGRADLADRFVASYARASGDYELYELVDFYEGYRAYVRGKVASLLAQDTGVDLDARENARKAARTFFLLSLLQGRKSLLPPVLVAVGGVIASGKSTIAERIADSLNAPVVSADRTRKELLGVETTAKVHEAAWTGAYSDEFSDEVYAELFRRAGHVLASGRSVLVDASFGARRRRERVRELARAHGVRFVFIECRASPEECKRRLEQRARTSSVSDGRLEIFDAFVVRFEPITELPEGEHTIVDTTRPLEENVKRVSEHLPGWPPGFVR
jgi:aminoglycoside phosphotransferase family enzyme/predicted kinase